MTKKTRKKSAVTIQLEAIAAKSGLGIPWLRELHRKHQMPLELHPALKWLSDRPDPGTDPAADDSPAALRRERIRLTALQSQKAQLALDVERGLFVSREEHDACGQRIGSVMKAALLALETNLPPALQGLKIHQSRPRCREEIRKIQELMADDQSELWRDMADE